ncbi:MAG TPA: AsmA-like C-terminal region-containing protein [Candidatus Sulfotelmatobacter sp.]|nr:AsmA-like C-terminal region-containing protein [Candidatus Sulfotelmatobacter sp.]
MLQHFSKNKTPSNMASAGTATQGHRSIRQSAFGHRPHGKIALLLAIVAVCGGGIAFYYVRVLSFSQSAILRDLQEASGMNVTVRGYHRTHFPSPGCVLDGVEFRSQTDNFTLIQIDHLVIKGTYAGLLRHHVQHVKTVGTRVFVPPFGSHYTFPTKHSNIVVDQIIANGALVAFVSSDATPRLVFDVHDALLTDVRWGRPIRYQLKFHNPQPPGEISVAGTFGPWADGHHEDTPMTGEFSFERADLSVYGGISGMLASAGKFAGTFKHIDVEGTTDTPDFEVTSGGHKVPLSSHFAAYVDAIHGDTFLKRVEAHWGHTTVFAEGSVAGSQNQHGKIGRFRLTARNGRLEDILGLFVSAPRSPMSGALSFRSAAEIPSGDEPFLKKVRFSGRFGLAEGSFSTADTQENVNELSAGARGESKENPETVLTDLNGEFDLSRGTARFAELSFGVPGASAKMHGTYGILNQKIDLHGQMRVDSQISKTSSGVKALLLKMMDPLFKKKKRGEIVPVHILGTYQKPECGLDLVKKPNDISSRK